MRKSIKLVISLLLMSSMLSGCIVWPWWGDGGHGGGHGGWHGGRR